MLPWFAIFVALVAVYFVHYYNNKQIPTIPNKLWPVYGMIRNKFSMRLWTQWMMQTYGDIVYIERGGDVSCFLFKPEWTKVVLSSFPDRALMSTASETLGFSGLAMLTGDRWTFHRKVIAPLLIGRALRPFENVMEDNVQLIVSRLNNLIAKNGGKKATSDLYLIFKKLSLDTVAKIAWGLTTDSLKDRPDTVALQLELDFLFEEVFKRVRAPIPYWKLLPFLPSNARVKAVHKTLFNMANDVIKEKKAAAEQRREKKVESDSENESPSECILDTLWERHLEYPNEFTEYEVAEESISTLLGGAETIANVLICTFYHAARDPEVTRKLREEIKKYDTGSPIKVADLKQYTYTEWVFKETLRMYPAAFIADRTTDRELVLGPYVIPAGIKILMPPVAVHYNPTLFPDPYTFNPERWVNGDPTAGYFPFGGGARLCPGKAMGTSVMMLTLLELFRNFSFSHVEPVPPVIQSDEAFNLRPPRAKLDLFVEKI